MASQSIQSERAYVGGNTSARPGFGDAPLARSTITLLITGVAASLLFTTVYLIEGVTRPGYDGFQQAISALSLGPGGWLQQANFVVFGLLTILIALGWRQALAPGAASVAYPVLRVIEGIALVVDGAFSQDPAPGYPVGVAPVPPTTHGIIHLLFAFVAITSIACGWVALAVRFFHEPRWRWWGALSILVAILTIVLIALFGALGPRYAYDGVLERVATGLSSIFGLAVLARLLLMQARVARASAR